MMRTRAEGPIKSRKNRGGESKKGSLLAKFFVISRSEGVTDKTSVKREGPPEGLFLRGPLKRELRTRGRGGKSSPAGGSLHEMVPSG